MTQRVRILGILVGTPIVIGMLMFFVGYECGKTTAFFNIPLCYAAPGYDYAQ